MRRAIITAYLMHLDPAQGVPSQTARSALRPRLWAAFAIVCLAAGGFKHWQNQQARAAKIAWENQMAAAYAAAQRMSQTIQRMCQTHPPPAAEAMIEQTYPQLVKDGWKGSSADPSDPLVFLSYLPYRELTRNLHILIGWDGAGSGWDGAGNPKVAVCWFWQEPTWPPPKSWSDVEGYRCFIVNAGPWLCIGLLLACIALQSRWKPIREVFLATAIVYALASGLALDPRSPRNAVSIAFALTAVFAAVLVPALAPRWGRQPDPRLCRVCEYNLTGNVSGVCPECGTVIPRSQREELKVQTRGAETS